jgi:tripartite-type tricarboxylate transporter receptor subunit TctC
VKTANQIAQFAIAIAAAGLFTPSARADEVADFYKGKTLTVLVGLQAGTGFDIYGRALARHIGRYIPGNPNTVVQNMPGASGVNAANWLYNLAPKDGTVIGTFPQNVTTEPLYGNKSARYGVESMAFIGNMEDGTATCAVRSDAGVTSVEDLQKKEVIWGATGATGPLGGSAQALNYLIGTKLKIIYGYKGSASVKLAIQKDEVKGICGLPYSTMTAFWADMLDAGQLKLIIQLAGKPIPGKKGLAQLKDYLKTDEQREIAKLIFSTYEISRLFTTQSAVPAARIKALRAAFDATMKDKQFLADAEKTKIEISAISGEEAEKIVQDLYKVKPETVKKAYAATIKK